MNEPENVELLLKYGADVNLRPQERDNAMGGWTAAEVAADFGQFEVVEMLLAHGANALDGIAEALQARRWPKELQPRRVEILRKLHARGAKIYASRNNPDTPAELISPGKWKYQRYTGDKPVAIPEELLK